MSAETKVDNTSLMREAWSRFHGTMEQIRIDTEQTQRFRETQEHRAKAYHTLFEIQAMAYNFAIAPRHSDPRIQVQTGWHSDYYTLGQNCPDFVYGVVIVDGRGRYRLRGRNGDIAMTLFQVHNGITGEPGVKQVANHDLLDFTVADDGTFEIALGAEKQDGNWIPLDADRDGYHFILIRRVMLDPHGDHGEMEIERLDTDGDYAREEFDEAHMARRIDAATDWARYICDRWNIGLYDGYYAKNQNQKNRMELLPRLTTSQVGNPLCDYAMGIFELADDEGLLIELSEIPDAAYWSFQVGDVWSRSLHFTSRQSSLNQQQLAIGSDGVCRVVLSPTDPGIANWLDSVGRHEGVVCFRNYRASIAPLPTARKVKLSALGALLPADTQRVSPAERARHLTHRRAGYRKMLGE